MAPVASVIRTLMAVPWGRLTVQVYELPLTFSAMVESAGAEVWPWGIAALDVSTTQQTTKRRVGHRALYREIERKRDGRRSADGNRKHVQDEGGGSALPREGGGLALLDRGLLRVSTASFAYCHCTGHVFATQRYLSPLRITQRGTKAG